MYHQNEPPEHTGNIRTATHAMIMLHGRGASASNILNLHQIFDPKPFYFIAPQASNNQWYPQPFTQPTKSNQPWLDHAIKCINNLISDLASDKFSPAQIYLFGFSQGACLALEFAARYPQRYAGIISLSGGLIGTDLEVKSHSGDLAQTPVYLSCSRQDPYIPFPRIELTHSQLTAQNAHVTTNFYDHPDHSLQPEDIKNLQSFTN